MKFLALPLDQALAAAVQFHLAGGVLSLADWDALDQEKRDILSLAKQISQTPSTSAPSEEAEAELLAAAASLCS